ncbi:MAG: hypothetical protein EA417_11575 [Gammaproteobacteria bacterium]|nr:MAG: hypothetical protein EA417_11575 [Gammaproteobacteria bacterium]
MTAHIVAAVLALMAGGVALSVQKGGALHRGSGLVFVVTMVIMAATGAALAAFIPERLSVVAGGLTLYLVVTSLLTVRPPPLEDRSIHWLALAVGVGVALLGVTFGIEALVREEGQLDGFPAPLYFIFASVSAFGALADLRMLRSRPLSGHRRIARHLWRMCLALFIATASFFLGQAQVFPEALRHFALLSVPVAAVLLIMGYWLVRVLWLEPRRARAAPPGD